mgnify:CR=1 FL=1
MSSFGINVFNFGAKGDGIADDTAAIQSAINYAAERGGGKILFLTPRADIGSLPPPLRNTTASPSARS